MPQPVNLDELVNDIKTAASSVLHRDVTSLRGFSERQVKAIAQQTQLVAMGIASGQITEETREFFLDSLEDMTLNFVKTLRGLMMITIEKVWNAVVGVLWKFIEAATGLALPSAQ